MALPSAAAAGLSVLGALVALGARRLRAATSDLPVDHRMAPHIVRG
jgi:hypothetical protein